MSSRTGKYGSKTQPPRCSATTESDARTWAPTSEHLMSVGPGGSNGLHASAQRIADALAARGVRGPFREFAASTKTAADAATALHCEVGAIASCLVFVVDDEPVVVIKSGALRVDTVALCAFAGGTSVRQATPDEVRR